MFGVSWENSGRALFDTGDQLQSGRTESTTQSLSVSNKSKIKHVQARHGHWQSRSLISYTGHDNSLMKKSSFVMT